MNSSCRVILVRYGEIALKGENRRDFETALRRNIERGLANFPGLTVRRAHGRFFVEGESLADGAILSSATEALSRIPGIVSLSPAVVVPNDLEQIQKAALETVGNLLREDASKAGRETAAARNVTFKVSSRRAWKGFPLKSPEIDHRVGACLLRAYPGLRVDVHRPSFTVGIEVREEGTYLFCEEIPGPGGLPAGTAGKGVLLLSGGIDSPVAGYLALKRGITVLALHFWSYPITSQRSRDKAMELAKILRRYDPEVRFFVAPFTETQTRIMESCPERYRVVVMRRMMIRVAEAFAGKHGALCIITGENVGQVASQTLESLKVIEHASSLPVLRPLACFDKRETIDLARKIGTYETSCLPYEDCCTVFVPKHPVTRPRLEEALEAEKLLDVTSLVSRCVEGIEEMSLE